MRVKRTERGWAGHFICGDQCRFRRNTLLEVGDVVVIVSTVGNMVGHDEKPTTIGCDRNYETMAFLGVMVGPYWEVDVSRWINFDSEWAIEECENETDLKADKMHEAVVTELRRKMAKGETFDRRLDNE